MAGVKFSFERMQEVRSRLVDIKEQLRTSTEISSDALKGIANNIQSDEMQTILKSYAMSTSTQQSTTIKYLTDLDEYLALKIGDYQQIDATGIEDLTEVQNLLSQLEQ